MRIRETTVNTLLIGTAELNYTDQGQGDPLLLVHGAVFSDWFRPLAASAALQGLRVIRVCRAGYKGAAPSGIISIREHSQHLLRLLDDLEISRVHLAGHSSGALIALQLAADHPNRIESLALIEPAPAGPFQVPAFEELAQRFIGPAIEAFAAGDTRRAFDNFMQGVCCGDFSGIIQQTLGPEALDQALAESHFFFGNEVPAVMAWQFETAFAEHIRAPVLIVEGGAGRLAGPLSQQVTETALRLFPAAEVRLISNTTHLLPLQAPEELGRTLARFVRQRKTEHAQDAASAK